MQKAMAINYESLCVNNQKPTTSLSVSKAQEVREQNLTLPLTTYSG